ncbi:MAG: hypothetical protein K2P02_01090 [Lachnospiraceae bacterium]|nr:hypothetical protein [Lachnospiraceae bacterium]
MQKRQIICLAASTAIFALVWIGNKDSALKEDAIRRSGYGEEEIWYEVLVSGLEEKEIPIQIPVSSRKRREEEARRIREEWAENLPGEILQQNTSLREVRSDLNLISYYDELALKLEWETGDSELIDSFGKVYNQEISEQGKQTWLQLTVWDNVGNSVFHIPIHIYPPRLSDTDKKVRALSEAIETENKNTEEEEWLILPGEFEGEKLSYRLRPDYSSVLILVMGGGVTLLYGFEDQVRQKEKDKKRKEQLILEYSEVASKLQVYLGAGMTVRTAWEKMALDYKTGLAAGRREVSPAYEEVVKVCIDLQSGVAESEAYRRFGRRCGLRPYMKLASLLEQNRKTGLKNLRYLLEEEVAAAFEERKNIAKRLGEEAGTKLLLPLFLMLGIVMVMVVAPAFLSFY